MKTKPFNLEEALAGAKVITRSGKEVNQLTLFKASNSFPLFAVIDEEIHQFNMDGKYSPYENDETDEDLFIAIETKKVYANVYEGKNGLFVAPQYFTDKKTAIINKNNFECLQVTYIKTIEITDEPEITYEP